MRDSHAKDYSIDTMLSAIEGSGAVVSTIARRLGCDWNTAKKYIERREETRTAYANEQEAVLDMCESTIYTSIKNGDTHSAKWVLATKGRQRGFGDKPNNDPEEQAAIFREIMKGFIGEG